MRDELTVLPPWDAASQFGKDAVFLVTIWNEFHWFCEPQQQLKNYGCDKGVPYPALHWRFPETFLPCLLNDLPSKLYLESDLILNVAGIWLICDLGNSRVNIRLCVSGNSTAYPAVQSKTPTSHIIYFG